ncbi:MAG TPA: MarR family transcriptional regulator [Glycomyces sp.]|nr:MarR family transcriptional regulator [Glycomyces sp.]
MSGRRRLGRRRHRSGRRRRPRAPDSARLGLRIRLRRLEEEGCRATELAQWSGQHKQVVGKLVDELEALGYVERRPDPADRRAKLVVPTERDQMRRSGAIMAAIEARIAARLGDKPFAEFKRRFNEVSAAAR